MRDDGWWQHLEYTEEWRSNGAVVASVGFMIPKQSSLPMSSPRSVPVFGVFGVFGVLRHAMFQNFIT